MIRSAASLRVLFHMIGAGLFALALASARPGFAQLPTPETGQNVIQATLPVRIQYSGSPAFGYTVSQTQSQPAQIRVAGPANRIGQLTAIATHPLDITGKAETIVKQAALQIPDGIAVVDAQHRVRVRVAIEKQFVEKTFEDIPVQMVNNRYPAIVQPDSVTIAVRSSRLFFANHFSPADIRIQMDLKGLEPGLHVRPVEIRLPEQAELLRIAPQVFTVQILSPTPDLPEKKHAAGT